MLDAQQYFLEIVRPALQRFEQNPRSRLDAFLACVAIFHTVDYLGYPKRSRSKSLREEFCKESEEFKTIDRVAHAFKHVTSGDNRSPTKPPLDARNIIDRPPGYWDIGYVDMSRCDGSIGGLTLKNDRRVDLLEVAKFATEFLDQKLNSVCEYD